MEQVNAVPVVGGPLAYGIGVAVLLLMLVTGPYGKALVTVAHEGGHYVVGTLLGYSVRGFELKPNADGETAYVDDWWSPARIVRRAAGYATPPLLGWGGAVLIAGGRAWSVLWITVVLLLAAFFAGTNQLMIGINLVAFVGIGWAAVAAEPTMQAAIATGVVWLMLLGGMRDALEILRLNSSGDGVNLARDTLIPRRVWHAGFAALAVLCLWKGARALLGW